MVAQNATASLMISDWFFARASGRATFHLTLARTHCSVPLDSLVFVSEAIVTDEAAESVSRSEHVVSRRAMLGAASGCFVTMALATSAHARSANLPQPLKNAERYQIDSETTGSMVIPKIHDGKGEARIKLFPFDGASAPANFITYELPPGSSEGVHVHHLDNRNNEGSFDEYYYIMSGSGQMEIDGKIVPVKAGDHVHTPLGVAHGIENTHSTENMRVFLTFISRGHDSKKLA